MDQAFTLEDVESAVAGRLKLAFGARNLGSSDLRLIAEQAGIIINKLVNDSNSDLFSVDSLTEGDVIIPLPSGVYQTKDQDVVAGLNTINLPASFPDASYQVSVSVFGTDGSTILYNDPTNLTPFAFDIFVADAGHLHCTCIRNT